MFKPKDGEVIWKINIPKDGLKEKLIWITKWIFWGIPIAILAYCVIFGQK